MKISSAILLFVLLLSINRTFALQGFGNERALFVELFGTNLFNVNDDGDLVYEREVDLINFCTDPSRPYKVQLLVLNLIPSPLGTNDLRTTFSNSTDVLSTVNASIENRLGNFLYAAHNAGITYISAQGTGYLGTGASSKYKGSHFFRNVNEFNKRMMALHNDKKYCFDIIYTEIDFWIGDPVLGGFTWDLYRQFFRPGSDRMLLEKERTANHTVVVGSGNEPAGINFNNPNSNPFFSQFSNSHNQILLTSTELQNAGLSSGDVLNSMELLFTEPDKLNTHPTVHAIKDLTIKIGKTTSNLNSGFVNPTFTSVFFSSSFTPKAGLNAFNFSNNITWNGTDNIIVDICFGDASLTTGTESVVLTDITTPNISSVHTHSTTAVNASTQCSDVTSNFAQFSQRPVCIFKTQSSMVQYPPLLTATYLGDLSDNSGLGGYTSQEYVDGIDERLDIIFDEIYFTGWQSNCSSCYFNRDFGKGSRLLRFSQNTSPTFVIPLFSFESGANDFFGDYTQNIHGIAFPPAAHPVSWDLNTIYNNFIHWYATQNNPYAITNPSPTEAHTMEVQTEVDPSSHTPVAYTPNDMSFGLGIFKYGNVPDSRFYTRIPSNPINSPHTLPDDQITVNTCSYDIKSDQIVLPSTSHINSVQVQNGFSPVIEAYRWYVDGTLDPIAITDTYNIPTIVSGSSHVYTYEIVVNEPSYPGYFPHLEFKSDVVINGYIPTGNIYVSSGSNPVCPNGFIELTCTTNIVNGTFTWNNSRTGVMQSGPSNVLQITATDLQNGNVQTGDIISVTLVSNDLCSPITVPTNSITINIFTVTTPSISLATYYCIDHVPITLSGMGSPLGGSFYINTNTSPSSTFDPASLGLGNHSVRYDYTDPINSCLSSATQQVRVDDIPLINVTDPINGLCVNGIYDLNLIAAATPSGGTYSGTGVNGSTFTPTIAGPYNLSYSYTDGNGCSNTRSFTANVNALTTPTVTLSSDNTDPTLATCIGADVDVNLTVTSCTNCGSNPTFIYYHWDDPISSTSPVAFNGSPITNTTQYIPQVPCSTIFYFVEVFPSADACPIPHNPTDFNSNNITVDGNTGSGSPPYSPVRVTPATCIGASNGTATIDNSGCLITSVDYSGPISGTSPGNVINNLPPGNYSATIHSTYTWCNNVTYNFTIIPFTGSPLPFITPNNGNLSCNSILTTTPFFSYQWNLNGQTISGITTQQYTATADGHYSVTVTDQNGCIGTSNPIVVNTSINSTITGPTTTCGTGIYSVPVNTNNAYYQWTVPIGATYTHNTIGNTITINWGSAYPSDQVHLIISKTNNFSRMLNS